jgi:hypothetical protein
MQYEKELDTLVKDNLLLNQNKDFLGKLFKYLEAAIETENPHILREEIAEAYRFMAPLIKLKARAEALYRLAQKASARNANLKGTGRDAEINGDTASYRYARDLLEGWLDTLNSKLSAAKTILASLDNEMKNIGG